MRISDISPFVRNAMLINFKVRQKYGIAGDSRLFYTYEDYTVHIDGTTYNIGAGSVVIVPAGVKYFFEHSGVVNMLTINFDYTESASHITEPKPPRAPEMFSESKITERPDFEDYPFLNSPIVLENMQKLRLQFEKIVREFEYKKPFYREVAASVHKQVIFEIIRLMLPGSKSNAIVNSALEYIHAHYAEDIDNESVAAHVGYHSYYLNRVMKAVLGTTLRQYIIDYRLEIAKRHLQQTGLSISAIAELSGYRNLCNFSVDFKKKTGMTPSKYRELS
ncbi:MAG: helix-turn-helix transcriptional regulator [Clostridia bacterium]|nr:helix-turn-helix transcriptional regulator [Clostridia bacterium]